MVLPLRYCFNGQGGKARSAPRMSREGRLYRCRAVTLPHFLFKYCNTRRRWQCSAPCSLQSSTVGVSKRDFSILSSILRSSSKVTNLSSYSCHLPFCFLYSSSISWL